MKTILHRKQRNRRKNMTIFYNVHENSHRKVIKRNNCLILALLLSVLQMFLANGKELMQQNSYCRRPISNNSRNQNLNTPTCQCSHDNVSINRRILSVNCSKQNAKYFNYQKLPRHVSILNLSNNNLRFFVYTKRDILELTEDNKTNKVNTLLSRLESVTSLDISKNQIGNNLCLYADNLLERYDDIYSDYRDYMLLKDEDSNDQTPILIDLKHFSQSRQLSRTDINKVSNGKKNIHYSPLKIKSSLSCSNLNPNFYESYFALNLPPNLKQLELSKNQLRFIPNLLTSSNSIIKISFAENKITNLGSNLRQHFPHLLDLDLSNNRMSDFDSEYFPENGNLKILNLTNNKISRIIPFRTDNQGNFSPLKNLEILILSKNRLKFTNTHNQLVPQDENFFSQFINLKELDLSHNLIQGLRPLFFKGLDKLEVLKLNNNTINTKNGLKAGAFYPLNNLKELILDDNEISSVDKDWLYQLINLEKLSIKHNQITTIKVDWLSKCNFLDLSFNNLRNLERNSFNGMVSLENLSLNNNEIRDIEDGTFLELNNLKQLNLSTNEISGVIEDISGSFSGLENLLTLDLSKNHIKNLKNTAFDGLENLEILNLQDNQISTIQNGTFSEGKLPKLIDLKANRNNFNCNCKLSWFPEFLRKTSEKEHSKCTTPRKLADKDIYLLEQMKDFNCLAEDELTPVIVTHPERKSVLSGTQVELVCEARAIIENPELDLNRFNIFWKKKRTRFEVKNIFATKAAKNNSSRSKLKRSSRSKLKLKKNKQKLRKQRLRKNKRRLRSKRDSRFAIEESHKVDDQQVKFEIITPDYYGEATRRQTDMENEFLIKSTLRLSKVELFKDTGLYLCVAANTMGSMHSAQAKLTVMTKPKIIKLPKKISNVQIGSEVKLSCQAEGEPAPKIRWEKEGNKELNFIAASDRRIQFKPSSELGNGEIIITHIKKEDSGSYKCIAENSAGRAEAISAVNVYVTPKIKESGQNSTISSFIGSDQALKCDTNGFPVPKISWFKDGKSLKSLVISNRENIEKFVTTQNGFWLIVDDLDREDEGVYTCEATNELGTDTKSFYLKIQNQDSESKISQNKSSNQLTSISTGQIDLTGTSTYYQNNVYCENFKSLSCHAKKLGYFIKNSETFIFIMCLLLIIIFIIFLSAMIICYRQNSKLREMSRTDSKRKIQNNTNQLNNQPSHYTALLASPQTQAQTLDGNGTLSRPNSSRRSSDTKNTRSGSNSQFSPRNSNTLPLERGLLLGTSVMSPQNHRDRYSYDQNHQTSSYSKIGQNSTNVDFTYFSTLPNVNSREESPQNNNNQSQNIGQRLKDHYIHVNPSSNNSVNLIKHHIIDRQDFRQAKAYIQSEAQQSTTRNQVQKRPDINLKKSNSLLKNSSKKYSGPIVIGHKSAGPLNFGNDRIRPLQEVSERSGKSASVSIEKT